MYNKSEADQLEAAIQASLEEVKAAQQQHAYFTISDDDSDVDYYEVSSDVSDCGMEVAGSQSDCVETSLSTDSCNTSRKNGSKKVVASKRTKRSHEELDEVDHSKHKLPKLDPADSLTCNLPGTSPLCNSWCSKGSRKNSRESEPDSDVVGSSKKLTIGSNNDSDINKEKTTILVRLPDGRRMEQCFYASSSIQVYLLQ